MSLEYVSEMLQDWRMKMPSNPTFNDITGKTFNRLTVIEYVGKRGKYRQSYWIAKCECGTVKEYNSGAMVYGSVKSCGCLKREKTIARNTKHGLRHHPLYPTWNNMMNRCSSPNCAEWHNYGGRGITVCERWKSFENFAADMGPKPSAAHSIERREVDGNYNPDNCFWGTLAQQANNKRSNRRISFDGQDLTVSEWAKKLGVSHEMIRGRLRRGHIGAAALGIDPLRETS